MKHKLTAWQSLEANYSIKKLKAAAGAKQNRAAQTIFRVESAIFGKNYVKSQKNIQSDNNQNPS